MKLLPQVMVQWAVQRGILKKPQDWPPQESFPVSRCRENGGGSCCSSGTDGS